MNLGVFKRTMLPAEVCRAGTAGIFLCNRKFCWSFLQSGFFLCKEILNEYKMFLTVTLLGVSLYLEQFLLYMLNQQKM